MLKVFFFKKQKFPWKFAEAGRLGELDHKKYELERFDQYINDA
jgi:hypothetical protein